MTLYYKENVDPQILPFQDFDYQGNLWTNLENNSIGREICGWVEAPTKPNYNKDNQIITWLNNRWVVKNNPSTITQAPIVDTVKEGIKENLLAPTPSQFFLLFSAQERVILRQLAKDNPIIEDWLIILNDIRLTSVDLSLSSTRQGIMYLTTLDVPNDLVSLIGRNKVLTEERAVIILQGKSL